jgi:hypothetical protein
MKYRIIHPAGKVNSEVNGVKFVKGVHESDLSQTVKSDETPEELVRKLEANGFTVQRIEEEEEKPAKKSKKEAGAPEGSTPEVGVS